MILETAVLDIKEESIEELKGVLEDAKTVISKSKGFVSIQFVQCIETPTKFIAFIQWETLEDHTIGFRESELFVKWRAILSPYFNSAPFADHYNYLPE